MRFDGVIKTWNDDRGFGFIEPIQGGQELFVHVKAFQAGTERPTANLKVSFEVEISGDGKKRAKNVQLVRPARVARPSGIKAAPSWGLGSLIALGGFILAYLLMTIIKGTSPYLALGYVVMSLACGTAYWVDKSAAQTGQWRVSEGTLLTLGLFGGWPGAIVAQQTLRHKTSKQSFRLAFWATVIFNFGAFFMVATAMSSSNSG